MSARAEERREYLAADTAEPKGFSGLSVKAMDWIRKPHCVFRADWAVAPGAQSCAARYRVRYWSLA